MAWHLDPVHLIWTKFGMDILVDPRNKPVEGFFIFLKIQDGRRRSKIALGVYFWGSYKLTGQFNSSLISLLSEVTILVE